MTEHIFLLEPKLWLGEGTIQLSNAEEDLGYMTKWSVENVSHSGEIECSQEIQLKGLSDVMYNKFILTEITPTQFTVYLENDALGKVAGYGIITPDVIGWEFRIKEIGFEGFEFYERQSDGSYHMRAEFSSGDQFRTTIRGKVWQKIG